MNLIASVDLMASSARTPWHRASALSKLLLGLLLVFAAVAARSLPLMVALDVVAWILALSSGMPVRLVIAGATYPLFLAGLFVLATWGGPWRAQLLLLLKPLTATLAVLWLIGTTPYPDLFAPISRVLPRSLGDGLFLTYRALFDLLGRAEQLWQARRMRGADSGSPGRRLATAGEGLGTLVLHSFDRSQRIYATMLLRGHSGRICGCRHWAEVGWDDLWVLLAALVVAVAIVMLGRLR